MILRPLVLTYALGGANAFVPSAKINAWPSKGSINLLLRKHRDISLSNEPFFADQVDPQENIDLFDLKLEDEREKFFEPLLVSDDIAGIDEGKEIFLESLASTVPDDAVADRELDVSNHVQSLFAETGESSKADAGFMDVQAVLDISGEAAAAAEASMPPDLIEQLDFSSNATTTTAPIEIKEVSEILSASSVVVGEPVTAAKIEAPKVSKILKFAIPAIGVWLCGPLLSLIDTSAVGLLSGTVQQAALNPAVAVTDYAALLIAFMYTGTTNLVASAQETDRGTADKPRTTKTLIGAMQLSTFVGAGLGTVLFVFARPLLSAIIGNGDVSPAIFGAAMKYVRIRALGMPAAAIIGSTQAACLGMQDIRSPLYVLAAAAVVNFFGDMLFVSNAHPLLGGAAGAAWATVISQYAGLALFIRWLCNKPEKTPPVMNVSKAILEITGKPSSEGGSRRQQLRDGLQNFNLKRDEKKRPGGILGKLFRQKTVSGEKPQSKGGNVSVRGFLQNKFSSADLVKPPSAEIRKEFAPYLLPVTTTQVGRVSGYVAMSHVVASSLGTTSMAAQQVIVSLFYCLCPIADSLSLTAQSFIPSISEKPVSAERAAALRRTSINFVKAGAIFGVAMMAAVSAIPLLSGFFTSDPIVVSMVNSVVPLLLAFFGVHGVLCGTEGVLLGQKDLGFVGKMYGGYFFAVPYLMLRVKKAALAGSPENLTSVWSVFLVYQMFRFVAWLSRVAVIQRRTEIEAKAAAYAP